MPLLVTMGAQMSCSLGTTPSILTVTSNQTVISDNQLAATIMDHASITNIPTFGMCQSPSNPVVIAATAAKLGAFTPMPCVPNTVAPWTPGATSTTINNQPALHNACQLICTWAGIIAITEAGQKSVTVT